MSQPRVYLAGPITGLTFSGSEDWRDAAGQILSDWGISAYSPLRGKDYLRSVGKLKDVYDEVNPLSTAKGIVTRDYNDCLKADLVLANLLGAQKVSIGTVMEIAWAYSHRVPCVVVMEDGNPHDHGMITHCAGFVVDDLDAALAIARAVLLP